MTAKSIADILDAAADLITPEGAWSQGANARGADGYTVPVSSRRATCFCMAGAIMRVADGAYPTSAVKAVLPAPMLSYNDWLVAFNDAPNRTQAEVIAKLREAATLARTSTPGEA